MLSYGDKIFKKITLENFQTGGRAPGAQALDPPLIVHGQKFFRKLKQFKTNKIQPV